jgi:chromosome segregation protein
VHAEEPYRAAIEAALGEAAGLLIVDTSADAEQGIALLKQEEKGKVTFVALDRVPVVHSRFTIPRLPGVVGWALDHATCDPACAPLFRYLLDRVLIVDSARTAAQIARTWSGIRCVTIEGEILSGVGITRGGSRRQDEGGTIGKTRQIGELEADIAADMSVIADRARSKQALQAEHDAIDLKSLTEAVKDIEKEMNGVEMRIAQLEFEKKRASDIILRNTESAAVLTGEIEELLRSVASEEPRLVQLIGDKGTIERALGAGAQELGSLEEEWNARSAAVSDVGISLVNARNELQNAHAERHRTLSTITDITGTLERNTRQMRLALDEIAAATLSMEDNDRARSALETELREREEMQETVEADSARLRTDAHQRELRIKDHRRTHDDSMRLAHEHELKILDLKAKADHLCQRALEEFELPLELKRYPDNEFVDFAALRDEIHGLREKVKSMGNINFAAFEEYTEEKKRYEFLSTQRKDLLEAEKTLLSMIEEINATAQRKFLETFALIRTNFIETFKSLFDPGDECDLRLEEDVDPLEAGIDIVAKPRGKRPTSIDLLSGGEKTLTAIALLFAIYLVKPSPFCILDEVDAPLDDANIDRFTRILRKFSDNTQFIVVTHNKRTMEAANALYGVTMEEEGVSKIVTVRFNQQSQLDTAAVASA